MPGNSSAGTLFGPFEPSAIDTDGRSDDTIICPWIVRMSAVQRCSGVARPPQRRASLEQNGVNGVILVVAPGARRCEMTGSESLKLALGGFLAMAAALGIGRFVYTPILPLMIGALGWSKVDAGLVASANFLGYLLGAVVAGWPVFSSNPRRWLLIALVVSAATTAGMATSSDLPLLGALRFAGGIASAFVIICGSTLVLEQLSAAGRGQFAAVHFAGVGAGIIISAAIVAVLVTTGARWQLLWATSGLIAALAAVLATVLIRPAISTRPIEPSVQVAASRPGIVSMTIAYGLFGFGYVITTTFLVTIVRETPDIRPLEPWIWMLFGFAAVPSVPLWQTVGLRIGFLRAYAVACLIEAMGVAASVEWVSIPGVCIAAVLVGGTFMGLTALGLMSGRSLSGSQPQRVIGLLTASFGAGQMIGPTIAGFLSEPTGNMRTASLIAAAALVLAAGLAFNASIPSPSAPRAD
jgi:MFS family permease